MANARKTKRTSDEQRVDNALSEYAARAALLPSVAGVALVPGPERDLFTYIDVRDWDVMDRLQDIEEVLWRLFDETVFDYHVRYLEGRSFDHERPRSARVIYQRAEP